MINKTLLLVSILLHYFVFIAFLFTVTISVFVVPWYVWVSLTTLIIRVIFSTNECPLTRYENYLRKKLKLKQSTGFLKDYILHPISTLSYLVKEAL